MKRTHLLGLLLWRGGLLMVGAFLLIEGARWLLRFVDLPVPVEIGGGLVLAGIGLVLASLIVERVADARAEREFAE
jgi:hypothetical protein